jgi:hypothetical protein
MSLNPNGEQTRLSQYKKTSIISIQDIDDLLDLIHSVVINGLYFSFYDVHDQINTKYNT